MLPQTRLTPPPTLFNESLPGFALEVSKHSVWELWTCSTLCWKQDGAYWPPLFGQRLGSPMIHWHASPPHTRLTPPPKLFNESLQGFCSHRVPSLSHASHHDFDGVLLFPEIKFFGRKNIIISQRLSLGPEPNLLLVTLNSDQFHFQEKLQARSLSTFL